MGPSATVVNGTATGKSPPREWISMCSDDGSQREGRFQHREVFTDARARSGDEREKLPAVAALGGFRAEPFGIEYQRSVPQRGIPVQGIDSHGHDGARLDSMPGDRDVADCQPRDPGGGRLQPERLAQHLDGVSEPGHILGCQLPIADLGGLRGDASPARRDGAQVSTTNR